MKEYTWDFNRVLGDTIKEKYENFCELIASIYEIYAINSIVASPEIMSIIEVLIPTTGMKYTPLSSDDFTARGDKNLVLCGYLEVSDGSIQCYRSYRSEKDEVLLLGENWNSMIKVKNFVM